MPSLAQAHIFLIFSFSLFSHFPHFFLECFCCRYRRWTLNPEEKLDIVVRCEIDGVINNKVCAGVMLLDTCDALC